MRPRMVSTTARILRTGREILAPQKALVRHPGKGGDGASSPKSHGRGRAGVRPRNTRKRNAEQSAGQAAPANLKACLC
jgi:hypothetical protein